LKAGEPTRYPDTSSLAPWCLRCQPENPTRVGRMKKLLLLVVIIALGAVAAKKLRVE
jgi:hypothetical protein